ncbi:putative membrane protein [Mycobacterium ulcerans str. Harvey]|uniref:Membrane protein n=1 Tax=Mycobacterium ulcerans str. Harvey TaxID=1299332 RepID=A0ABN0QY14_MYCUL|nr:putative membrane protein [Mycobacterium ulcerans str. Harvey]
MGWEFGVLLILVAVLLAFLARGSFLVVPAVPWPAAPCW